MGGMDLKDSLPTHSCGFARRLHLVIWTYSWGSSPRGFPQSKWSERRRASLFYDLITEVTRHHFQCLLLVTQTNPGRVWEDTRRDDYEEVGIIGGHLGDWLSQVTVGLRDQ